MKCSVYIATSVDGYIAKMDDSVDWLHAVGDLKADMGDDQDMGFNRFIRSVDCMIMGRKCMEVISNMNIPPEQWPYGNIRIVVLSHSIQTPPDNLHGKVEMYAGDIQQLVKQLTSEGIKHAYIDGGTTITAFLNLKLIDEMIITKAPILLGEGIPLFGKINHMIQLEKASACAFPNDFIQIKYKVSY
ncbi:dihydrofolate reductase family protein [Shewanella surugensis]|uniref:Dihydrofolate reductase family protein n=1 Tax=Shewanella surugensis TaxID=212020 RepID=A0ABT0L828_9GAMM|nr:dihydrofolate reductase family protein [Shewanella surugensis]MCL1123848.1 dihydrofolate reductase family protein [Shewanella surugensis]